MLQILNRTIHFLTPLTDYYRRFQLPPAPQIELILEKPSLGVLRRPMVRIRRKYNLIAHVCSL